MRVPLPERRVLKAEILRRVAAGETLKSICAEPGMPRARTVYGWTWKDEGFDATLSEAMQRGRWMRLYAFDDAKARAFLARLAVGEPITKLVRDPTMPSERTLRYWRNTQGEFAAEVRRMAGVYQAQRVYGFPRAARYRPWTEAEGDKVLVKSG